MTASGAAGTSNARISWQPRERRSERQSTAGVSLRCYRRSLEVAAENELKTIAFPAISTGIYGFPVDRAAHIAVHTVSSFLSVSPGIAEVIFCCFSEKSAEAHRAALGGAG